MSKYILIIVLLTYGVFGSDIFKLYNPQPAPEPISILNVNTPTEQIIERVKVFNKLITDPSDRAKIAIFNYEFANRVSNYSTDNQQVNDVYTLAAKIFFENSLVDKYDGLAENITSLMQEIISDDNHNLTIEEKYKLRDYFMGVAWTLIQKD